MKPSGIQVNKPVLAFLVVVILAVVWYLTSGSSKPETVQEDLKKGDKSVLEPPVKLPEGQSSGNVPPEGAEGQERGEAVQGNDEVINLKSVPNVDLTKVKVEDNKVKVRAGTWELDVTYIQGMPTTKSKQDVLLLHGASFSAQNWKEIKTLETFGALGYRMVAINRPDELKASVKKTIALEFLVNLIQALKLDKPIVVSPSASGELAIPLLGMGEEHIRGFVSLAPVATDLFTPEHYKNVKVPILIVYGEKDTGLGHQSLENLKNIPNHKTYVMKDGGHAAYISKPDVFHQCLYSFLEDITAKNT